MTILHDAKVIAGTEGTDGLFWVDPWTKDGAAFAAKLKPVAAQVRLHAEAAITLIAQARAANPPVLRQIVSAHAGTITMGAPDSETWAAAQPASLRYADPYNPADIYPSNPTSLREPNAIDAMELGARRIDFLALKFQLTDEMQSAYTRAYTASISTDPKLKRTISRELSDINGVNGRMQDLTQGYAQLRDLFAQAWLRTNRPFALRPVLEHYDLSTQLWQQRADKIRVTQRQYSDSKTLPSPAALALFPTTP